MVACLKRTEENAEFHPIVDFLTTSSIYHALTQIHATVDGKTVVISESSVRRDLHFNDEDDITCLTNTTIFENLALMGSKSTSWNEFSTNIASVVICLATGQKFNFSKLTFDEPFNDTYETPKHTTKVFTNMKRQGKGFSRRVTSLFASMLAPPVVKGEGSGQPSEPQPPSSTTQPIIEDTLPQQLPPHLSPTHPPLPPPPNSPPPSPPPLTPGQALHSTRTPHTLPQASMSIPNVAYKAVFKDKGDRVVRVTTTAASFDATHASGLDEGHLKHSYDSPLPGVNTSESDEERIEQHDLTDFIPPTPYDSPLLGGYTPESDESRPNINELMAICIKLSNRILALENSKTAQDLVIQKLRKRVKRLEKALRVKTPGMKLFKIGTSKRKALDKEDASKQGRKSEKTKPMFNVSDFDVLDDAMENVESCCAGPSTSTARDIFEDEMTTIADTIVAIRRARPRKTSVVIHVQARMDADALLATRLQEEEIEQFSIDEQAKFLVETIVARKKFGNKRQRTYPDDENVKRQKIGEPSDTVEEVYIEALYVKYPIIDWEVYSEDTRKYWRIIRDLVNERFSIIEPIDDKEKELWVELKRFFEPDDGDTLWKLQRYMHDPLVWRLYDACGVHHVSLVRGHDIFMLVEKDYPLSKGVLMLTLVNKLLVEQPLEMANELLKKIFIQAERSRQ
ncbi:hypothetical protein Tco_1506971 [Tanacetum coccineum]